MANMQQMMIFGGNEKILTAGTTGQIYIDTGGGPVPAVYSGYSTGTGTYGIWSGALGSLNSTTYNGATIINLVWNSSAPSDTTGVYAIEVTGNRAAGFITSIKIDDTTYTLSVRYYDPGYDTTSFYSSPSYSDTISSGIHRVTVYP